MPLLARIRTAAFATFAGAAAVSVAAWSLIGDEPARAQLGLLTTLPVYWGEAADISEAIDGSEEPHWVRSTLEEDFRLVPLDTLTGGNPPLDELGHLLLAQPRALSPAENVALDEWVRGGGRVLIFADPLLTGPTRFPIGDRRRPQDVVLLSPILRRWGLELEFDPDQAEGERSVSVWGASVPVAQAGAFVKAPASAPSACSIDAAGLVAECTVGRGRVVAIADAALLEQGRDPAGAREALEAIAGRAFGT